MYGYFYIKFPKRKSKVLYDDYRNSMRYYLKNNYTLDWLLYDYMDKPENPKFKNFLDVIFEYIKVGDTIVVLSLFQLGKTKNAIYNMFLL